MVEVDIITMVGIMEKVDMGIMGRNIIIHIIQDIIARMNQICLGGERFLRKERGSDFENRDTERFELSVISYQ